MSDGKDRVVKEVAGSMGETGTPLPVMPLTVVAVAELAARDLETGLSPSVRRRIPIDRQSFDEVMAGFDIRVSLDVEDRLSGSDEPCIVEIELKDLKAFRPGSVARQVPAARELLEVRKGLLDLRAGKTKLDGFRSLLDTCHHAAAVTDRIRAAFDAGSAKEPSPASPASPADEGSGDGGDLDALLAKVDSPASGGRAGSADLARLDAVIRDLVRSGGSASEISGRTVDQAVGLLDDAVSLQVDHVLHHPEFRRLEAAWKGLKFLLDRTDFEKSIRIEILSANLEELIGVYDEVVHEPEVQGISEHPVGFVLVDQTFGRDQQEIDRLRALSERGAALSIPVITNAGALFLGLDHAGELSKKATLRESFAGPDYTKWRGLRDEGPTRWLGLTFNRFLLRGAYEAGDVGSREFRYTESLPEPVDRLRLWGNGAWAVASLAVRSFGRIGWCTDIMGQRLSGTIEDLPVRLLEGVRAEPIALPVEYVITDKLERDLCDNGLMALTAPINADKAFLRFAPSVHAPRHYVDPLDKARAKLQSTLPFQLFVGRVVNYALMIEPVVVPGAGKEQIEASYRHALHELLSSAGSVPPDAVRIGVLPNEDDASVNDLVINIRWPGFQSLQGAGDLELRWPLGH